MIKKINYYRLFKSQPVNNALFLGSRGTGNSSLIKATLKAFKSKNLRLIEIQKNDLQDLPEIIDEIRDLPQKYITYCDDFSFERTKIVMRPYKNYKWFNRITAK